MLKFAPPVCFNVIETSDQYNEFYCYSNIEILIMAVLNTILVIYLTVLYFKAGLRSQTLGKLLCKVKTSILLMLVVYEMLLVFRYAFDL